MTELNLKKITEELIETFFPTSLQQFFFIVIKMICISNNIAHDI